MRTQHDLRAAFFRFGFGPRPGDAREATEDPRGFVLEQLDAAPLAAIEDIEPAAARHLLRWRFQRRRRLEGEDAEAILQDYRTAYHDDVGAWFAHVARTPFGFSERLAAFWSNRFTVSARVRALRSLRGPYENDVIRRHALGRFPALLKASADHPAMLLYLDQATSVGPNSPVGRRLKVGVNENYARELLELHTLGSDGGYGQSDVFAVAQLLTGWGVADPKRFPERAGRAFFNARRHEGGRQTVLARSYGGESGLSKRDALITELAHHDATARDVARRLAESFTHSDPPPPLVDRLAANFRDTGGDLRELARTLVRSDEAWAAPLASFVPPQDLLVALARAFPGSLPSDPAKAASFVLRESRRMGQPFWEPPSPAGYRTQGDHWRNPQALALRLDHSRRIARRFVRNGEAHLPDVSLLLGAAWSSAARRAFAQAKDPRETIVLAAMSPEFQLR